MTEWFGYTKHFLLACCCLLSLLGNSTFTAFGLGMASDADTRQDSSSTTKSGSFSETMKAIVYEKGASALKLTTRVPPKAGCRGSVLVKVNYAGLNPVDAKGRLRTQNALWTVELCLECNMRLTPFTLSFFSGYCCSLFTASLLFLILLFGMK